MNSIYGETPSNNYLNRPGIVVKIVFRLSAKTAINRDMEVYAEAGV